MNSKTKSDSRLFLIFSAPALLGWLFLMFRGLTAAPGEPARAEFPGRQDFHLGGSAGIEALYDRLHAAATRVCTRSEESAVIVSRTCEQQALQEGVERVGLPELTAYYQLKGQRQAVRLTANR